MSDKIYIKLTHNQDKQAGDNRPSFVAPINPKSPEGKTWRNVLKLERVGTTKQDLMILMNKVIPQELSMLS